MKQSKVIGVTGGVGAGKSTLLEYVRTQYHYSVIEADAVGRRLSEKGKSVYKAYVSHYGSAILDVDGNIDRKKLYAAAFTGKNADVKKLNALSHPRIRKEIRRLITIDPSPVVFLEAALLYEGGLDALCEEIWYVYAPEKSRKDRLKLSRAYTDERSENIMAHQLKDEEFRRLSPVIIENSGSLKDFHKKIDALLNQEEA